MTLRIWSDDPERDRLVALAESLKSKPRLMCLLAHRPEEKRWVFVRGGTRVSAALPLYAVYTFEYEDSSYSESYYDRNPLAAEDF